MKGHKVKGMKETPASSSAIQLITLTKFYKLQADKLNRIIVASLMISKK